MSRGRTEATPGAGFSWMGLLLTCALVAGALPVAAQRSPRAAARLAPIEEEIRAGHLEAAEQALWKILSARADDAEALSLLGAVRSRQKRYAESEALLQRVVALSPSAAAYKNLAAALVAGNKVDQAIQAYTEAARFSPGDPEIEVELAKLHAGKGAPAEALAALGRIPRQRFPPSAAPIQAAALLSLGRPADAVALIPKVESNAAAGMALAEVFVEKSMPGEALQCLAAALGQPRVPARAFYLKGRALQLQGWTVAARQNYQRALQLAPNSPEALFGLASLLSAGQAVPLLRRAHELAPDSLPIARGLVVAAVKANQTSTASQAARDLEKLSPGQPDDLYLVATALFQAGNHSLAQQAFERYVAARPGDARAHLALGVVYLQQQNLAQAQTALERCLQLDPAQIEAEYQLGLLARAQGDNPRAIARLEKVVATRPGHAAALGTLGALYLQAGENQKAATALQRSAELDPGSAETQYQLSLLYSRLGKPDLARRHSERFRKLRDQQLSKAGKRKQDAAPSAQPPQ